LLCCIGDLVEDVVVWLSSDIALGTDTTASIHRRQGGSAANVAVSAASTGATVRFIGRVGCDPIGSALVEELLSSGVDAKVQREGRTGTIVVLVDADGERTMLPDRAAATELDGTSTDTLDGVTWLHVPAYSLVVEPLATTAMHAIRYVQRAGGSVSIDASSVAIINQTGADTFSRMLADLEPDVVFCNADEASILDVAAGNGLSGVKLTIVKAGEDSAVAYSQGAPAASVPALRLDNVRDTTGAGDAFAAGFITACMESDDIVASIENGHELAAQVLGRHAP
jgi:sugar/nucleoside kinase (ribokinase family)